MKQLIILFIIISISSCSSVNKNVIGYDINGEVIEEIKISKKEAFVLDMAMLVEFYTKKHLKSPTCADDLILWIESMDEDSQLVYYIEYKYLKKNRKKLVFTTDTENLDSEILKTICIYYKKAIPSKGLFKVFVYLPNSGG